MLAFVEPHRTEFPVGLRLKLEIDYLHLKLGEGHALDVLLLRWKLVLAFIAMDALVFLRNCDALCPFGPALHCCTLEAA